MCDAVSYHADNNKKHESKQYVKIQKAPDTGRGHRLFALRDFFIGIYVKVFYVVIGIGMEIVHRTGTSIPGMEITRICVLHCVVFQIYNLNIRHVIHRRCVDIMVVIVSFHVFSPFQVIQ